MKMRREKYQAVTVWIACLLALQLLATTATAPFHPILGLRSGGIPTNTHGPIENAKSLTKRRTLPCSDPQVLFTALESTVKTTGLSIQDDSKAPETFLAARSGTERPDDYVLTQFTLTRDLRDSRLLQVAFVCNHIENVQTSTGMQPETFDPDDATQQTFNQISEKIDQLDLNSNSNKRKSP